MAEFIGRLRKRREKERSKEQFLYLIRIHFYLGKHSTWLIFPEGNLTV